MDDFMIFCNYIFDVLVRMADVINDNFLLSFSLAIFYVSFVLPGIIRALTGDDDNNNGGVSF